MRTLSDLTAAIRIALATQPKVTIRERQADPEAGLRRLELIEGKSDIRLSEELVG